MSKTFDGRRNNQPPEHGKIRPGEIRNKWGCRGKPQASGPNSINEIYLKEGERIVAPDDGGDVTAASRSSKRNITMRSCGATLLRGREFLTASPKLRIGLGGCGMKPMMPTLTIEYIGLDELKPDPRNSRTHWMRQKELVAESIKRFGMVTPIGIGEDHQIVYGHARVEAARLAGLTKVPLEALMDQVHPATHANIGAAKDIASAAG